MESDSLQRRVKKLGELLLASQLITQEQLNEARRLQDQSGERLGSLLVSLDYLDVDTLVEQLGRQYGLPAANLFKSNIPAGVLAILPLDKMKKYKALPVGGDATKVRLAMADPNDMAALRELQFILGMSIQPLVTPAFQLEAAFKSLGTSPEPITQELRGAELASSFSKKRRSDVLPDLNELFIHLLDGGVSDLLLVAGTAPSIKRNNEVVRLPGPILTPKQVGDYARAMMTDSQFERFRQRKEIEFSLTLPDKGRFRVNIYKQRNSLSVAARHIVDEIPTLAKLGLPPWLEEFPLRAQGLILITGPTGHGKTTTMAALVDIINSKARKNVITIEDPIEYLHRHKQSNINQREVGVDTDTFSQALKMVLREAPDVIVIGEMRDPESFAIALQAADTGHLVLSCIHSNNAVMAINRIIDVFPPEQQHQIRVQLADNMLLILNQRLLARKDGRGQILALEKLSSSYRVRNLIREGKAHHIRSLLQQSAEDFQSLDMSLAQLVNEGLVAYDMALQYAQDSKYFQTMARGGPGRGAD